MKIATFNANSIRSRIGIVLSWLEKEEPDVLALQETKVQDSEFPLDAFQSKGWNVLFKGQKAYNGVAMVSKKPLKTIGMRLYPQDPEEEARLIHCEFEGVQLVNTYIPQGFMIDSPKYQYKLKFLSDLKKYFSKKIAKDAMALWMGDLNVAPTEIDLANPKENQDHVCFHVSARNALIDAMDGQWIDLFRLKEKGDGHYTFWDYRNPFAFKKNVGWRIDHILGTQPMAENLKKIWIDKEPRAQEKPSDHTFLISEFEL